MRIRSASALLVLVSLAGVACGTRVSNEQAASEAKEDARRTGAVALSAGTAADDTAGDTGDTSTDALAGITGGPGTATATGTGRAATTGGGAAATGSAGASTRKATGGPGDIGVSAREIQLGWVGTLTGPVPGIFRGALEGTNAFLAYRNSQGGRFGRTFKLSVADDSLDSGKNRAAHLSLKDKVYAFVGSFSINDDGGASVINDCKCPDVTGNLSKPMGDSPYHYGPQPQIPGWRGGPPKYYAQRYGKDVVEHLAFFVGANGVAREIAGDHRKVYEQAGFKVCYTREVAPGETNFTGDVLQMRQSGCRALAFQGTAGDMGRLAAAMREQNFAVDLPNWGNDAYNEAFVKIAAGGGEGMIIDQVYAMFKGEDGDIPEIKLFLDWMKRVAPSQIVDLFALYGWLSARLFDDALAKMEEADAPLTRVKLIETLSNMGTWDANGAVGPINVGKKKPSDCFFVFTYKGGKYTRIFPTGGQKYACDVGTYVTRAQLSG